MTQSRIIATLSLLIAAAFAILWRPVSLEDRMIQLQLERIIPTDARTLAAQPLELRALLVDYADDPLLLLQAQAALQRHPSMAPEVMLAFGDEPDFRTVLREYGATSIPPIHFFMQNEVRTVAVMKQAGELAERLRALIGGDDPVDSEPMPPALERGWYAVAFIRAEGHSFIGQFVTRPDGSVAWLQSERFLESINTFFLGGIRALETRARLGEPIRARDIGHAGIDVAIGVGVFKLVKATRGGAVATRQAGFATRSVALAPVMLKQSAVASRLLRIGAPLAAGYLMIRHPSLINSGLAWLAERLNLPIGLVQFGGWLLLLLPLLYIASLLLRPLGLVLGACARMAFAAGRLAHGGKRPAPASPISP
ncbi:hypothetical protein [Azoarcus taiwanensis]|uniref:Uncharacterized protein n=1 Tax=Azoarcus taiwanensis TaxID=666964 RepID=A0A972FKK0_9RHOO|nr:hypothetical protein [Azoarcus taiwanensis]NMG03991.1 hypothetical protein [Azoarcus taiwanensis]